MHKGYAFVQFTNPFDARNACHGEDGRTILSQILGKYSPFLCVLYMWIDLGISLTVGLKRKKKQIVDVCFSLIFYFAVKILIICKKKIS